MKVDILGILSFLTDLTPLILLLMSIKLLKKSINLVLFFWCVLSVFLDVLVVVLPESKIQSIAFYTILSEPIFVIVIYLLIAKNKLLKIIMIIITIVFIIIVYFHNKKYGLDEFSNALAGYAVLQILILSLLNFIILYKDSNDSMINNPNIFIFLGYMIYTSGSLFLFTTTEKFPNIFIDSGLWSIFLTANIIKNLFLVKYVLEARKKITT